MANKTFRYAWTLREIELKTLERKAAEAGWENIGILIREWYRTIYGKPLNIDAEELYGKRRDKK